MGESMLNFENKLKYNVYDLQRLIKLLRSPEGCPWDRVQTHESIRRNFLEETYEAVEAIDEADSTHLCEELGDVLTQVIFHADIEQDAGRFDLDDVADMCVRKLVSRHPHVFGNVQVSSTGQVLENRDAIKRVEKNQNTVSDSVNAVAKTLPALWRAEKIQKKAAKSGFDWKDAASSADKLGEELGELREAIAGHGDAREELGDLLFSAVNAARHLDIDPEQALHDACDKFSRRFEATENAVLDSGRQLEDVSSEELLEIWKIVKKDE